ncbi:hypothetical protein AB0H88_24805 [Nonomuraea sp. NPDC050680]|uniref:hypothetical protein n=1 Tax=Nonomuraea sp. NPDC050680 TaxID=3154630 RepID=UPI0033F0A1CB
MRRILPAFGLALLSLAYGVFEEGIMTMSLFNPNYAGQRLLDLGFVPALGIGVPWTLFVLALHTVWSMSVPIALTEELTVRGAPRRGSARSGWPSPPCWPCWPCWARP